MKVFVTIHNEKKKSHKAMDRGDLICESTTKEGLERTLREMGIDLDNCTCWCGPGSTEDVTVVYWRKADA